MLTGVLGVLSSPRRRRRLSRLAILAALAGGTTVLVMFLRNTGHSYETPLRNEPAQTYVEPKIVELPADALAAAQQTAYAFVRTAVAREHLEDSWPLAHPLLRQGMTHDEWVRGDSLPVIPYPADLKKLRYRVEYSYANLVSLAMRLEPKRGFENGPMTFAIELRKSGHGKRAHWLVSNWSPIGLSISGGKAARSPTARPEPDAPLGAIWLFVPALLFTGILAIPAVILTRSWLRGRRAERAYRAEHGL
jgi:hypothetical protein